MLNVIMNKKVQSIRLTMKESAVAGRLAYPSPVEPAA